MSGERQPKRPRSSQARPVARTMPPNAEPPILGAEATAAALIFLFDAKFGGQPERRAFRAAHSSVREISGRPLLGSAFLDDVAMHLARAGYDLVRMESYVVVQQSSRNNSMRRAPATLRAAARHAAINSTAKVVPLIPQEAEESDER